MSEKKSLGQTIKSFNKTFWVASAMELFERWAWYGFFGLFGLYLVASTDEGGLGFNHIEKGSIMGNITAILYLLPVFFGVIADRIGYKLSLTISYIVMIAGYYLMGEVSTYWSVYMIFLMVAIGAAFFKPVASGIIARNTDKSNGTMGFGIFYMMVNIGGFTGPAMSSYLRTEFGWKIIFVQAAVVIGINLLILLFFFKEPKIERPKESVGKALKDSLMNIFEALKDKKLTILLILMIGFWTMFNQLFYTLPNFIDDWVNSSSISNWINSNVPFLSKLLTQDGQLKPEWFVNLDALMIILLQIVITYFITNKMSHLNAMIRGAIIASIGVGLTFYTNNPIFTLFGVMTFAIGEMMSSPTLSSFIALITPKGKEALYQGTYFLPVAAGNFFTGFISGGLYEKWSDKLSLLKTELGNRNIEMPEVVSKERFIEEGAKSLGISITEFENQFNLKDKDLDYAAIGQRFTEFATEKGIDVSGINLPFSKSEYFALAEQKLGLSKWELTSYLWENYQPNKIWFVVFGIGIFSVISLYLYNKLVIKPLEKKE